MSWDPVLDWTPMTKATFEGHLASMEAEADEGEMPYGLKKMGELLDELVTAGQDWADEAFLDVLRGNYGANVRRVAISTIENGFKESGSVFSFTRFCVQHKKLSLLAAVADLGLPHERLGAVARYERATTSGGLWLDILANLNHNGPDTSFARQVFAFSSSEVAPKLADILVKHDPQHRDIEEVLKGSQGYAVVIDALMRSRIDSTPAAAAAPSERTRHRRAGL